MTDYTKSTDFAAKDTLLSGDPLKLVRGSEINTEFVNIQTAISSKLDSVDVSSFMATVLDDATAAAARGTLGAAVSGANTDITSVGAVTGVTATLSDNTTKLATTAFVQGNIAPAATETVAGRAEIATVAEVRAWTDNTRMVTPLGLASASIGMSQPWTNVAGVRSINTNYINSTGKPKYVTVVVVGTGAAQGHIYVGGLTLCANITIAVNATNQFSFIVPTSDYYNIALTAGSVNSWLELTN